MSEESLHVLVTDSSNIEKLDYFPKSKHLYIAFRGGKRYRYTGIPRAVWNALVDAESRGKFFSSRIRGQYPTEKL